MATKMIKKTLESKISKRIKRSKEATFVISDFSDLSDKKQVSRILSILTQKKLIIRLGRGVYTRVKISSITKQYIPEQNLRGVAITALKKFGITILPTLYEQKYNEGKTTQVPTGLVIGVDKKVNRKIGFNGRFVKYEKVISS